MCVSHINHSHYRQHYRQKDASYPERLGLKGAQLKLGYRQKIHTHCMSEAQESK